MKKIKTAYFKAYGRAIILLMSLAGFIISGCKSIKTGQRNSMKTTPCDSSEVVDVVPLYGVYNVRPERYGSIFGKVINAQDGKPIDNALVRLYIDNCPQRWSYSQKDGRFQVSFVGNIEKDSEYKLVITPKDKKVFIYENNEITLKAARVPKYSFNDTVTCKITVKRTNNGAK